MQIITELTNAQRILTLLQYVSPVRSDVWPYDKEMFIRAKAGKGIAQHGIDTYMFDVPRHCVEREKSSDIRRSSPV